MKLVVDVNNIISSLIKEGKSIEIILNPAFELYSPEFAYNEFLEHGDEIIKRTKRPAEDFIEIFNTLKKIIRFFDEGYYADKLREAVSFCPDVDDIDYFALSLKLNCPIWSNDKKLKEQNKVKIYSTEDLVKEAG